MLNLIKTMVAAKLVDIRGDERGADAFEYLLVIGVVVVAVIGAVALGFPGTLIDDTITSVNDSIATLF